MLFFQGVIDNLFTFTTFYINFTLSLVQLGLCLVTDRIKGTSGRSLHVQEDRQNLIENDQLQGKIQLFGKKKIIIKK